MKNYINHYLHLRSSLRIQKEHKRGYELDSYNKYKCIFIHIPKTGGVAVSQCLFGSLGGGHRTIQDYQQIFGPFKFRHYFKFCLVRDPVDRMISAYNFLKQGGMSDRDAKWRDDHLNKYADINDFIINGLQEAIAMKKYHFIPQYKFIVDISGKIRVDYIARFENIKEEVKTISDRIGIQQCKLPHKNKSIKIDYELNDEAIESIRTIYREDYQKIGFE